MKAIDYLIDLIGAALAIIAAAFIVASCAPEASELTDADSCTCNNDDNCFVANFDVKGDGTPVPYVLFDNGEVCPLTIASND